MVTKVPWEPKKGQYQPPFCLLRCAKGRLDTVVMVITLTTGIFVLYFTICLLYHEMTAERSKPGCQMTTFFWLYFPTLFYKGVDLFS